jgi:hypothetical protein
MHHPFLLTRTVVAVVAAVVVEIKEGTACRQRIQETNAMVAVLVVGERHREIESIASSPAGIGRQGWMRHLRDYLVPVPAPRRSPILEESLLALSVWEGLVRPLAEL